MGWYEPSFEEPARVQFAKLDMIGDAIEGVFAGTEERKNGFGKTEVHVLIKTGETEDGPLIESLRTNQRLLAQVASVKRGAKIRIEYVDDRKNDGVAKDGTPMKPTKLFKVQVDDGKAGTPPATKGQDDIPF